MYLSYFKTCLKKIITLCLIVLGSNKSFEYQVIIKLYHNLQSKNLEDLYAYFLVMIIELLRFLTASCSNNHAKFEIYRTIQI